MKKLIYCILAIPIFLECIRADMFTIDLSPFPFSLGKSFFIIIGFYFFLNSTIKLNNYFKIFLSITLLIFFASLISIDFIPSFSRATADIIILVSSLGWVNLWNQKIVIKILDTFMIFNFLYWSYYVFDSIDFFGSKISYTYFFNNFDGAINHHISGFTICLSGAYILTKFFLKENKLNLISIILILFTCYVLFLTESRSNLLVYLVFLLLTLFYVGLFSIRNLIFSLILIIGLFNTISFILQDDVLLKRFSLDYDEQLITNAIRVDIYQSFFIELFNSPLGKGALDSKILCSDGVYRNPHNNFLSYAIRGGIISLILILYFSISFFRKIFDANFFDLRHVQLSSLRSLCLILFLTLFTIDFGGLLYIVLLSLFFTPILKIN